MPQASTLAGPGHHLLATDGGPLDLLGVIGAGRDYDALVSHSRAFQVEQGLQVLVLDLPTLIRTKEEAGREKDRAVLAILRRTLDHDPHSPP